jgi:hypothetical protein
MLLGSVPHKGPERSAGLGIAPRSGHEKVSKTEQNGQNM